MPKIEKYSPGDFCYFELGTTDQLAAKPFYEAVMGWRTSDVPMGPAGVYTRLLVGDAPIGGAYTMTAAESAAVPPHWNLYIAVENAEAAVTRVRELGGKVIEGPFDVNTFGRMAVIQDPTGAYFNIWEARDHPGAEITGEPGAFCWADLSTPNSDKAKAFYEALFGWKIAPSEPYPPDYEVIRQNGKPVGGIPPSKYRDPATAPHWMLFFLSKDVDASAAQGKEMGGSILVPPTSMGDTKLAILADPQGAIFSIIRSQS